MTVPITQVEEVVSNPPVVFPPNIMTIYGDANLFSNLSLYIYSDGISNKTSKIRKPKLPETQLRRGRVLPKSDILPNITNNPDDIRTTNDRKISLAPAVASPLFGRSWIEERT